MFATESPTLKEARRVMTVCNACRYCEGFCAVFPAMEQRRSFPGGDLEYLANLCHNCTSCFHSCQYAPPQEWSVNNAKTMAELRVETYGKYAWPPFLAKAFRRNGALVSAVTAFGVVTAFTFTFLAKGPQVMFSPHRGTGAFYRVIPLGVMETLPSVVLLLALFALFLGLLRFVRGTSWNPGHLAAPCFLVPAIGDVLALRYLGGGGDGCNFRDETFSHLRRWMHQAVFFGFLMCVVATTVAAVYEHFLHRSAPYGFFSIPVATGSIGGLGMIVGTSWLLWGKLYRDPRPFARRLIGMEVAFLAQLFLTSLTGLLLLALRGSPIMATALAVHLGFVLALFLTLPCGEFVHAIYRFAALVRFAQEKEGGNGLGARGGAGKE